MQVDALLFDKDGTLFLFEATWESWAYSVLQRLAQGDMEKAAAAGARIGFDMSTRRYSRDSVVIAGTPAEVVAAIGTHFNLPADELEDILNDEAENAPQVEAVALIPFLEQLRANGLQLGVATNDAESPARAHLDAAGVTTLFDFVSGYDSGYGSKPDKGPCVAFASHCGVSPDKVAMVGDSLHDLRAGRAAGMKTIGVLTGLASRDELSPHADVVLEDIGHIPALLGH